MDPLSALLFAFLGSLLGVVAGLFPGLHPNTIAALLVSSVFFGPMESALVIVAAAVTNSFVSFIPSVLVGAPEAGTELSVLPGHRMLMEGRGLEAIKLSVIGGLSAFVLVVLTLPIGAVAFPILYEIVRPYLHIVLLLVVAHMVWKDKQMWGVLVFLLAGLLGLLVLDPKVVGDEALFPLLTGLFGLSGLVHSMRSRVAIPAQKPHSYEIPLRQALTGGLLGAVAGTLVGLLPGVGATQATYLTQEAVGERKERTFLISMGGVNTADSIVSILALWLLSNPRSGAAVAIETLLGSIGLNEVLIFLGAMALAAGLGALATLVLSEKVAWLLHRINYGKLSRRILWALLALVFLMDGLRGLVIATVGTAIGLVAILSKTRRSYLMGCLLVPTILFFWGV